MIKETFTGFSFGSYKAKYHLYIEYAVSLGWYFDFNINSLVSPSGKIIPPKLYGKQRYPSTSINLNVGNKTIGSFPFHKFVAFQKYGTSAFEKGVHVRHLDGNVFNLSYDNIVLGSAKDNEADKSPTVRKRSATIARKSQGYRSVRATVTKDIVMKILREYLQQPKIKGRVRRGIVRDLSALYGVTTPIVQAICNGRTYKDVYNEVLNSIGEGYVAE